MTKSSAALGIRLARIGEPGANLYNAYNYLTQVSTLYAQAVQGESRGGDQRAWQELCDEALSDLGDVFHVWEIALKDGRSGKAQLDDARLGAVIVRDCQRAAKLMDHVGVWTPRARTAGLLRHCERQWRRILTEVSALDPVLAPRLEGAIRTSHARSSRLTGMIEKGAKESVRIDACFKVGF